MGTEFGELLADFDLGFLNSSNNETLSSSEKIEKQRKAILIAKRKTIATDSLLKKYYEKKETVDLLEKTLFESKMECKQVCIEYRNSVEKIGILEENERKLQHVNRELEERNKLLESQCSAFQSHAHQLQELIKTYERKIGNLEADNETEKLALKESEKTIANLEKNIANLEKTIANLEKPIADSEESKSSLKDFIVTLKDILLGKEVLDAKTKLRLKKFSNKSDVFNVDDSECEDDSDWITEDHDDTIFKDTGDVSVVQITDSEETHAKIYNEIDRCAEISSSVDTGRGSSLASDSEKCFYSPDYVSNDSLIDTDPSKQSKPIRCQDAATSPISFNTQTDMLSPEMLSPLKSCEPSVNIMQKPCDVPIMSKNTMQYLADKQIQTQKECLEVNGRNVNDNFYNNEVTSILNEIQLHFELVTPIPPTPKSFKHSNTREDSNGHSVCLEASKIREEIKEFHSKFADLAKEVLDIKATLSQHTGVGKINTSAKPTQTIGTNKEKALAEDVDCGNYAPEVSHIETDKESRLDVSDDEYSLDLIRIPSPHNTVDEEIEDNCTPPNKEVTIIADRIHFFDSSDNNDANSVDKVSVSISDNPTICDIEVDVQEDEKVKKKRGRRQRITKLEKMRLRLQPKSKIRGPSVSIKRKSCLRPTPNIKEVNKPNADSSNLNNKEIYERALAVVAEIRAKNKQDQERVLRKRTILPRKASMSTYEKNNDIESRRKTEKVTEQKRDTRNSRQRTSSSVAHCVDSNEQSQNKYTTNKGNTGIDVSPQPPRVITRSRAKEIVKDCIVEDTLKKPSTPTKRPSTEDLTPDLSSKRKLRSSLRTSLSDTSTANISQDLLPNSNMGHSNINKNSLKKSYRSNTSYEDLELFEDCDKNKSEANTRKEMHVKPSRDKKCTKKENILCKMIDKYGTCKFRRTQPKKIPDCVVDKVYDIITNGMEQAINAEYNEVKHAMNLLVERLKSIKYKHFILAFIKYLKNPDRKMELLSITCTPPLPPMSKSEQILLYILSQLNHHWDSVTLIDEVLQNIEYHIFRLNSTPDFTTIDTMSHFYAVLCRFSKAKNKLRLFMLDAMYCIGYKAIPLIKQCISVWVHVLPFPHMRSAKNPLVICLIYLLHFYKCDDKYNRVQEIRAILQKKYSYELAEWNETKIIEQFRTSIMDLRDNATELSLLRVAIVIYAKRLGARWCEKNIIQNLLVPIIMNENNSERIRRYCISLLGPLVRPFPAEMKVNSEIVMNQLINMLDQNSSHTLKEAIFTSLLYISKHDHRRVSRALLDWKPERQISEELEQLLRTFVRERPLDHWISMISRQNI